MSKNGQNNKKENRNINKEQDIKFLLNAKRNKENDFEDNSLQPSPKKPKLEIAFKINIIKRRRQLISFTTYNNKVEKLLNESLPKTKKDFHKIFNLSDINPKANFLYFQFLNKTDPVKFNKYKMSKYIYTLEYNDAKILNFFKNEKETEILKLSKYRLNSKIENPIKEINSLSKVKLINLLCQLNEYYINDKTRQDYKSLLSEYKIKEYLKFKLPNNYGNYELQFYTYLQLFIYLFDFEEEVKEEKENENNIENDVDENDVDENEEEYFSSSDYDISDDEFLELDDDNINNNIKKFNSFIKNNNLEIKVFDKDIITKSKTDSRTFKDTIIKIQYLNNFSAYIINNLIVYEIDNNVFLSKIEFIYYNIIYFIYNYNGYSKEIEDFKYTLYEPKDIRDKRFKYFTKKEKIIIENFKEANYLNYYELSMIKPTEIESSINNPLNNIGKFFQFPLILKKNIITYEEHFFNDFKEFIFQIYQSKLMKQIFYYTEEFSDFFYPFEGKEKNKIFNEMFSNTSFYPLKIDKLHGYTCKLFTKILITTVLKDNSCLEKIIISFNLIINTIFHEQLKHYIKASIHYNSLRINHITPLESDDKLSKESLDKYLKIVKKKKELINNPKISKEEFEEIIYSDGGDKMEIILYGQKLQKLYIKAAIKMLDLEYYNMDISDHLVSFLNDNKSADFIDIKEEQEKNSSFLKTLLEFIKKYSDRRISKQSILDGKYCLQRASFSCQDPGSEFIEFKRISIREFMGTS